MGPSFNLDPLLRGLLIEVSGCELNKLPTYITTEITIKIRMMQQMVYPPAVIVSEVKFLMMIVSTITEMTHNMMNSYMYERLT